MVKPVVLLLSLSKLSTAMYMMYLTGQHNVVPDAELVRDITHVGLAFLNSGLFTLAEAPTSWPLFTSVEHVRPKFPPTAKIMVSIGGWGDDQGWRVAAASESSRKLFAANVAAMVTDTGADGVDIDWEYPGGNGEDYKRHPNSERAWEVEAYIRLLAGVRSAIGSHKVMSAAVPGLRRDMIAFTKDTIPRIMESLDFLNIMTYDLVNRRDNVTKHHTGVKASLDSIDAYLDMGLAPERANLGFAFYVKWFNTEPGQACSGRPLGCRTMPMEDPDTGDDLGQAGAFSWHDQVPKELAQSFERALRHGTYDEEGGGHYYFDAEENRFWSWETPQVIAAKMTHVFERKRLGGAFAWALGEDAPDFDHLMALNKAVASGKPPYKEEL